MSDPTALWPKPTARPSNFDKGCKQGYSNTTTKRAAY